MRKSGCQYYFIRQNQYLLKQCLPEFQYLCRVPLEKFRTIPYSTGFLDPFGIVVGWEQAQGLPEQ